MSRRRRPVRPTCVPTLPMPHPAPAPVDQQCGEPGCGVPLVTRRAGRSNDWETVDATGSRSAPRVGGHGSWDVDHYHRAVDVTPGERTGEGVPHCCSSPMWAAPDGWQCRVNRTSFPYAEKSPA